MAIIERSHNKKILETIWSKINYPTLLMGMKISTATMENNMEFP